MENTKIDMSFIIHKKIHKTIKDAFDCIFYNEPYNEASLYIRYTPEIGEFRVLIDDVIEKLEGEMQ